ncbi:class I SAM-dependent methyltransferase [Streptomyces sp. NPDC088197]|uniref:class I SAM-dependent methyltransferase n=1 Tax=Streptomyces sp. NPDC088197 TaxID=3365840 RepID=UPI0037F23551
MDDWTTSHHRAPGRRKAESWMFLLEAARDLRTTGAIAPSSKALARLLTDPAGEYGARPLNVLEAGAGTGSVTRTLLPRLSPGSSLDIVEANSRFTSQLRRLVSSHPLPADGSERIRVHHAFVEQLDTDRRYDVIVSGLPFTNFTPAHVTTIMDRYIELLRPGGTLTYFAYRGTRYARALTATRREARRHRAVEEVLAGYQDQYATGCRTVWGNLPPARVWRLRRPADVSAPAAASPVAAVTSRPTP